MFPPEKDNKLPSKSKINLNIIFSQKSYENKSCLKLNIVWKICINDVSNVKTEDLAGVVGANHPSFLKTFFIFSRRFWAAADFELYINIIDLI